MKQVNVQDKMLNALRRTKTPATITIVNGYQIRNAIVCEFDSFVVVVMADGEQKMVYKHAISTITPAKVIKTDLETEAEDNDNAE